MCRCLCLCSALVQSWDSFFCTVQLTSFSLPVHPLIPPSVSSSLLSSHTLSILFCCCSHRRHPPASAIPWALPPREAEGPRGCTLTLSKTEASPGPGLQLQSMAAVSLSPTRSQAGCLCPPPPRTRQGWSPYRSTVRTLLGGGVGCRLQEQQQEQERGATSVLLLLHSSKHPGEVTLQRAA